MDTNRSNCSLFITGIPKKATNEQLLEFFSSIGPLKSCFQVTSKSNDDEIKGKGYGFVQFAVKEDAQLAVSELPKEKFQGVKLKLEFALHRDRKKGGNDATKVEKPSPADPKLNQHKKKENVKYLRIMEKTVLLKDLPKGDSITKKTIFKKVKKFGQVVTLNYPASVPDSNAIDKGITHCNEEDTADFTKISNCAWVTYATVEQAKNAVKHLDNHVFKGQTVRAIIHPKPFDAKVNSRAVIRNIPFKVTHTVNVSLSS
jgi:nucleolar protein 4